MGDPKGFLKIGRKPTPKRDKVERIQDYRYIYEPMPDGELKEQASRCMDCGVPFCNTGCPLGNLIPDWNDLVHRDKIGGLLRYGIPDYKIEKWVVDRRIALLEEEGIEFRTGCHVGEDPTTDELKSDFDAVVLAVGALEGRDVETSGRELGGIHLAMDYLTQQNRRVAGLPVNADPEISAAGKNVIILGGGDTSADCLGNAHREGAASVRVLTHGPKPPENPDHYTWPDWPFVLHTYPVHEEGGERQWSVAVKGFEGEDGHVTKMNAVETERTPEGRTVHKAGTEFDMDADLVLLAIGFTGPVHDRLISDLDLGFGERGAIATANGGFATKDPGLFVAGDAKRGASLIVWAIAEGRKAAREADAYLMGESLLPG